MEINLWMILLQILPFAVAVYILNKIIYKPMLSYLAERERNIEGFQREARLLLEEVEQKEAGLEAELDQVRVAAGAARADILVRAEEEERALLRKAHDEADQLIDTAAERIAADKAAALETLEADAEGLAGRVAGAVLGRTLAAFLAVFLFTGAAFAAPADNHDAANPAEAAHAAEGDHGDAAAAHGDAAADAHGDEDGHHGAEPDWYFIGMHLVNAIILGFIIVRYGRRPVADFLASRKHEIASGLDKAKAMRGEAEERQAAYDRRMSLLDEEKEGMLAEARDVAESVKDGRIERANRAAKAIVEGAHRVILDEEVRARQSVRASVADRALGLAADRIRDELKDEDEDRLWSETLDSVGEALR